ncbi:MAG: hypothetical protein A2Y56_11905 [Candidatus Aminicenantes bacterium RBG_13_63_10]|nr:MAG: hypothetical protein A2Y56_11905 [Candidatus Aminicenantes bacterium RBG_13_63_10]
MKPIWYFVGLILLVMGAIILAAGLWGLFVRPLGPPKVLASLHAELWWGGFMILAGAAFLALNRRVRVE